MSILVTGGAGYIGSVTAEMLRARGERVAVLDNLTRGHRAAVDPDTPFYCGEVGDRALIERIARERELEACVHFAALAYVGESVAHPAQYFENNVGQGAALLGALVGCGVRRVIFSSTCAVYGEPKTIPMDEDHPQWPASPYGWTKLIFERMLASYEGAYGLKFVSLRYFNAAGATARHGEHHEPETHLIPNVLAAAQGRLPQVSVYGRDYPTPDGTAVRDYIHVADLGEAHALALDYLRRGGTSEFFNLGNGKGYSVLEVIETARRVTGGEIPTRMEARRPGDPARLVASAERARRVLGWRPACAELETIVGTAWQWRQTHPEGYPGEG